MDPEKLKNEDLIGSLKKGAPPRNHKSTVILGLVIVLIALLYIVNYLSHAHGYYTISDNNIHWHAHLSVTNHGRGVAIVAGVGQIEESAHPGTLHTHEDDGIIHMEIKGPVEARQIMLGRFFEVWGKDYGTPAHMLVNGKENFEHYRYIMRDKDEIELIFE